LNHLNNNLNAIVDISHN